MKAVNVPAFLEPLENVMKKKDYVNALRVTQEEVESKSPGLGCLLLELFFLQMIGMSFQRAVT